jgi:RNA polymerase primary sigma factor
MESHQPQKLEALDTLLEKADLQGYLTTGDIMEVFPWDGEDDERLLELFGFLHHQGVEIVLEEETEPEPDISKLETTPLDFTSAVMDTGMLPNLENISADDSGGLCLKECHAVLSSPGGRSCLAKDPGT